jgi:para-nitrobenzyl esterase
MNRFVYAAFAPITLSLALAAIQDPVHVQNGLVSGEAGKDAAVHVYKGIPYAAPPVGELRWKKPQAPATWQGTQPATEFPKACMQAPYPQNSIYYRPPEPMSEDCLYLNIWTAAQSAKEHRPVMVWVHGGGFTRGSGSVATYDGENLAKKGVIVVTINYRLGIFGFLAHPELTKESDVKSSGNYGLLDMVAALEWVQKNIAAFGGDPKRVTIFGESAGSSAVNFLMASPLAKGLFQRVVGESGANFGRGVALTEMEQNGSKLGSLASLRAKSSEELLKTEGSFRPCVDGWFLPESVGEIFARHKQSDVPVIAGSNADEARSLAPWPANATAKTFVDQAHKRYGDFTDEFLKLYPAGSNEQAAEAHYRSSTDGGMGWEMRTWVRAQTKSGKAPAYLYYFTRTPPWEQSSRYRAYHAAEIQYVFANLRPNRPWEDADRKLAETMSSYWANFAATGNPNGKGLPKWPSYEVKNDPAMEFGDHVEVKRDINKATLDFFDRFFAAEKAAPRTGSN